MSCTSFGTVIATVASGVFFFDNDREGDLMHAPHIPSIKSDKVMS